MPNLDFYAAGGDHERVLDLVFGNEDCAVYELHSSVDTEVRRFDSPAAVLAPHGATGWDDPALPAILLQIHPRAAGGTVRFRKTVFGPEYSGPGTFRFDTEGWGLVQLYLESPRAEGLRASHTNHNSRARALAWAPTYPDLGAVDAWDWGAVSRWSSRFNRALRKLAVATQYARPVLAAAQRRAESGLVLRLA